MTEAAVEFRYRGREISQQDILYIRALIEGHPNESRRTLSTKLCEAWQWRQANGALRDMVCRGMLLMLERAGQIALPPVSYVRHNPLANRVRPEPARIDTTPIEDRLRDLQPVEFEQVRRSSQEPLFNSLLEEHHKVLVRIVGQAPLTATVYSLERLRCGTCGQVFTAKEPEGVGPEKYDETAAAMIAQLKYGSGTPFYRLEQLEGQLGIPLPAATQWEVVEEAAELIRPARDELIRQAAQGEVVHNDDTSMRVLRLAREPSDERTGVFTSGVVSTGQGWKIALYFTGRQHAGENIADVLKRRAEELPSPIQMCDALSRNVPKLPSGVEILLANCLAHGRRQFVEVAANFPDQCRYVLEMLGQVYGHDAEARERGLTPEERLRFHQERSGPVMDQLYGWLEAQFAERKTEPNSGLGKAIMYLLRHWRPLTLFLRVTGAPLDNNIVERALKRAVLHRKNALFYRTLNGAQVGDLFMSLIHTCQLCGANSFDYLTELQRHAQNLAAIPAEWMPWNYRQTLERAGV